MSLGTGALKVGKVPEHFRLRQGGIHGNLLSRNHPCKQLPTGTVTLKPDQWKNTHLTPILIEKVWNFWREGRARSLNLQRFIQTQAKWSAEISLKTSKVPSQRRGDAWPLYICVGGNLLTPGRHKCTTTIGLILTLPKLYLATYVKQVLSRYPKLKLVLFGVLIFSL